MSAHLRRVGVIGWPLAHSLSSLIHEFWMREANLPEQSYEAIPVPPDGLASYLDGLAGAGFIGCNVTIPHKEAVFSFLRERGSLDANAERLQAVNTIVIDSDGAMQGSNTDSFGFLASLDEQASQWRNPTGKAVVIGAGGAARAILAALDDSGIESLVVINRTTSRAEKLLRDLKISDSKVFGTSEGEIAEALDGAKLLVNATSLGMAGADSWKEGIGVLPSVFLAPLPMDAIVVDIVYAPLQTELLQAARGRSLACVDGLGMLLYQAVPAFEAWFGMRPEVSTALRGRLEQALQER